MKNPGGKVGECAKQERKKSHLPFAGIILVRFYGYYLSLFSTGAGGVGGLSAPRELSMPVFRRHPKDK
jgi:hypothetical protein